MNNHECFALFVYFVILAMHGAAKIAPYVLLAGILSFVWWPGLSYILMGSSFLLCLFANFQEIVCSTSESFQ